MESLLSAPIQATESLVLFWSGYFQETPNCSVACCGAIALDVDPFFPYLDDLNRCHHHRSHPPAQSLGSVS